MQLIILASGRGSRLKKLTSNSPKCLTKIKSKPIISYLRKNFKKFEKIFLISGYKESKLKKINFEKKVNIIKNKKYNSTNMVQSMFCAAPYISKDVIITYADIIFNPHIIDKMITINKDHIPLNENWLNFWKQRMPIKEITKDAENIEIEKKYIKTIGKKIISNYPRGQYMGLIRLKKKTYFNLFKIFKKLNNPKIDMTSFLNFCIKKHNLKLSYFYTKLYWFEIDTISDHKIVNKIARLIKL